MTQAEHNALVTEPHKFGMQVMAHVTGFNAYQMAIQSKSDIIQHLPADFPRQRDYGEDYVRTEAGFMSDPDS